MAFLDTYLTTAKIGAGFLVIRLDPEQVNDPCQPFELVSGPHRSRKAANAAARKVAKQTGERLTNENGDTI